MRAADAAWSVRRRPRGGAPVAGALGVAAAVVVLSAGPASADPPAPTDFRSEVESVEPVAEGVEVAVVGGDAFLELRVDEGHEVTVEGYQGEPYLRFDPDGTVERNLRSPATYLNESRDGDASVPASADVDAEPDWEQVADDGSYAWHDHGIHYMGAGDPPGKGPGDVVQEWSRTLVVDGTPTTVEGRLVWLEPANPLPWVALGILAAGAVVVAWRRRLGPADGGLAGPAAAVVAGALGLVLGWGQYAAAPAGAGGSPLLVAVPLVGVLAAVAGVVLQRRVPAVASAATLGAVAAVVGWALLRLGVLWKPVLPTELPDALDRAGTALALGLAAATAVTVVLAGGLSLTLPDAAATDDVDGGTDDPDGDHERRGADSE